MRTPATKSLRLLLTLLLGLLAGYWVQPGSLAAQDVNRAALVIRSAGGQTQSACVEFSEPKITGLDLLLRSGLDVEIEVQGLGALVCRIDNTGCDQSDCWCQCKGGGDCVYWSYWQQIQGDWQYAQIGAAMYQVENGMVEGWSWGPGSVNAALEPAPLSFADVCGQGAARPEVTPGAAIVVPPSPSAVPTKLATASAPSPSATVLTSTPAIPTTASPTTTVPAAVAQGTAPPAALSPTPAGTQEPVRLEPPPLVQNDAVVVSQVPLAQPTLLPTPAPMPSAVPQTLAREVTLIEPTATVHQPPAAPQRTDPERAKIAAAPAPVATSPLHIIGSGAVPPSPAPPLPHALPPQTTGLDYLVFFVLIGFLCALLTYLRARGARE